MHDSIPTQTRTDTQSTQPSFHPSQALTFDAKVIFSGFPEGRMTTVTDTCGTFDSPLFAGVALQLLARIEMRRRSPNLMSLNALFQEYSVRVLIIHRNALMKQYKWCCAIEKSTGALVPGQHNKRRTV